MEFIVLLTITMSAIESFDAQKLDQPLGIPDKDEKYPFVVSFIREHERACTGTLIAANWVLTAGECTLYDNEHTVQYGNLSVTPSQAKLVTKIIKAVKHPSLRADTDTANQFTARTTLQLVLVETIPIKRYAHISATDYKTLTGSAVEHAYLEIANRDLELDPDNVEPDNTARPLLLAQGIVSSCDSISYTGISSDGPMMCVAPTCGYTRSQLAWAGDSGGPLFYEGKVIGVLLGASNLPAIRYTAVSPFIDWINLVITQNQGI